MPKPKSCSINSKNMMTKIKKAKVSPKKEKIVKTKKVVRKPAKPKPVKKHKVVSPAKKLIKVIQPAAKPILAVPSVKKITPEVKKITPEVKRIIPEVKKIVPEVKKEVVPAVQLKELELKLPISVKDLSVRLQEKPSVLIKTLMEMRIMAGINQVLDEEATVKVCLKFGYGIKKAASEEELALEIHKSIDGVRMLEPRPPIVTFMGHVDHGKTSLLDAIRKTKVAESEHGGITQHIGAYRVVLPTGKITFLDTPGHEAFTAMRSRGAKITDIVVLVVAADDGIMPQTQEAIDHARAAGVSIIVAMNKIDKPQANIERVKKQLSELNLNPEDWGGKTITVPVSAKTGAGIDHLLEMILLEAQMLELKANPKRPAQGVVLEAKITKGKGPVSTLLVQNGTLHLNENIIIAKYYGKIRAMFDDRGQSVTEVLPSFPVEVLGISGVPLAGEPFFVIKDEKTAKDIASRRQESERQQQMKAIKRISLEDLHTQIQEGKLKELKLIIKADMQGSLEAIKDTLNKLNVVEIKLDIIHEGIGNVNSSDVILAVASNALVLGFNVSSDERAKELIEKEGVDVRIYNIIYELANDIKQAVEGLLEPTLKKVFLGKVEVRKIFKMSRAGNVAGCFVTKGKVTRTGLARLLRNSEVVFDGKIASLKRFKDDVREVLEGFECGIALSGFEDLQEGDIIEAYEIEKIARKL